MSTDSIDLANWTAKDYLRATNTEFRDKSSISGMGNSRFIGEFLFHLDSGKEAVLRLEPSGQDQGEIAARLVTFFRNRFTGTEKGQAYMPTADDDRWYDVEPVHERRTMAKTMSGQNKTARGE